MTGATVLADHAPILAHQYGWDEILIFVVPIILALAGVRYAERRASRRRREDAVVPPPTDTPPDDTA